MHSSVQPPVSVGSAEPTILLTSANKLSHVGAQRTVEWEPNALIAKMRQESPNVLLDHAWTEWSRLADGSQTCAIVYGKVGASPRERGVPGYGLLHVYESWHQQRTARSKDILDSTGFRLGSGDN